MFMQSAIPGIGGGLMVGGGNPMMMFSSLDPQLFPGLNMVRGSEKNKELWKRVPDRF
jgi:hypothetical protein